MSKRIRRFDWSSTPLGPIETWPQSLQTLVDLMLGTSVPAYIACGPELTSLFNDAFVDLIGPLGRRGLGRSFRRLFSEIWEQSRPLVEATLAGHPQFFVDEPLVLPGPLAHPERWFTYCWSPVKDESGAIFGFYCTAYETTDKILNERLLLESREAALKDSEERYRALFETMDQGFCIIEMKFDSRGTPVDYRFVEANPAFEVQTGLRDVAGRWMSDLAPKREPHSFEIFGGVARTGQPLRFNQAAGALGRWLEIYAFPAGGDNGVALLVTDITSRRNAEVAARRLNETLELRVQEAVAARLQAEESLRQSLKLEAIGQLTGGLAHDFNNLLTVIRSSADLLRRPTLSDEKRVQFIDAIADTADRAARLTAQLLAFARRQALKPEIFDVSERIETVRTMLQTVVGPRIELTVENGCGRCFAEADITQFETALVNLAANARDAMNGAGRLMISVVNAGVPEGGEAPLVSISIADTGEGIPPERLEHVFEPFFTTKEMGKGTGLGLSQVYGFAKQSGGDLRVASTVGQGTVFTLYLRRSAEPGFVEVAETVEPAEGTLHGRVLIVEDNEQVGAFAASLLEELGIASSLVIDGGQALALIKADPQAFSLVFTDIVMPGISGIELGREIRRVAPALPVVLTSGYSDVLSNGATVDFEVLNKPYSVPELTRVLTAALNSQPPASQASSG